ncbi:MAG: hypothetical protein ACFB9N_09510 [Geitlerinemataceae cyanobacterium]
MDFIDNILDKLGEWLQRALDTLLGPSAEPEPEAIPIPVDNRQGR